jgi:2-succinyl-5-enolpyruvyl-6-hydroxy-3-cyclohexene-1-carboxylate synthase
MIDGPREAAESEEFFVTKQRLKAKNLCDEFGIEYLQANSKPTLKDVVDDFFHMDGKPKILELETEMKLNRTVFENLKQKIKERYEL